MTLSLYLLRSGAIRAIDGFEHKITTKCIVNPRWKYIFVQGIKWNKQINKAQRLDSFCLINVYIYGTLHANYGFYISVFKIEIINPKHSTSYENVFENKFYIFLIFLLFFK